MDTEQNITWQSLEYAHREHDTDWFWWLGVAVVAGVVVSILLSNVLLAILILVAGFAITLHAVRKPQILICRLTPHGLEVGNEKHSYKSLVSFWIHKSESGERLLLRSEKIFSPHIALEIPSGEKEKIKSYLAERIPEEEHEEPLSHVLIEFFKF